MVRLKFGLVFALAAGVTALAGMLLVSGGSAQGRSGDADCDGLTTTVDAAHILYYGAGMQHDIGCLEAADVNADGRVDSKDAALILLEARASGMELKPENVPVSDGLS